MPEKQKLGYLRLTKETTESILQITLGGPSILQIGSGRSKRKEIHEVVYSRMTGRKFTPKFEKRTRLKAFVSDPSAKEIVEEILNSIGKESEPRGLILIKEISNAYEIGTRKSGDSALT